MDAPDNSRSDDGAQARGISSPGSEAPPPPRSPWRSEDVWSIWLGGLVLAVALAATWWNRPADLRERVAEFHATTAELDRLDAADAPAAERQAASERRDAQRSGLAANPLKPLLAKVSQWQDDPAQAFRGKDGGSIAGGLLGVLAASLALFSLGLAGMGEKVGPFVTAFCGVFLLALGAFVLASQTLVKYYNLEYALWALFVGLIISNTVGAPAWLRPAVRTEFYIKTGLVLLGAEVFVHQLLALGLPGVCIAWLVTPTVLVTTYVFGQRVLRIPSRSLNMVISADMSVCGVSAAIATAAACRAKREELSLAVGLSLAFTVLMMIAMPAVIRAAGMSEVLGGAWIGGTIDSTGAVAAAGGMLGDTALAVATTIKMIQNMLIGAVAFGVAAYWVSRVERRADAARPSLAEVWRRFPKFVLGFLGASAAFSLIAYQGGVAGEAVTAAAIGGTSETLRGWFFCLAFVSIGLETNYRELRGYLAGGKPLLLYVCGQALNLTLTLAMAWLMFEKVFPDAAAALAR